jgi:PAS domain S-box-containing protein
VEVRNVVSRARFVKRSPLLRYGIAVLAVGLALLLDQLIVQDWPLVHDPLFLLEPLLHDPLFLLIRLLLAAVVVSAWYGGPGSGLLAVTLGSLVTGYFLLPPIKSFPLLSSKSLLLVVFPLVGLLINWLVGMLYSAKQRAAEAQQRYHDLLDHLHAVVWEADAQTLQCTFVSRRAEEMLGYALGWWLTDADFWRILIHPEDREWAFALCRKAIHEGKDHDIEYRAVAADGRVVWLHDIAYVTRDAEGRVRGLRGLLADIRARGGQMLRR